jgi:hypothetical protein
LLLERAKRLWGENQSKLPGSDVQFTGRIRRMGFVRRHGCHKAKAKARIAAPAGASRIRIAFVLLAPAAPPNEGKLTPFRGHPVFVARHATATCCRFCIAKWHGISQGRALTSEEQNYIVQVLGHWLKSQAARELECDAAA